VLVGFSSASDTGLLGRVRANRHGGGAIAAIPARAWTPAYDSGDGAWVADATGVLDLFGWPPG